MKGPWLGVDAGGTKTHAVILNSDHEVVLEAAAGPGNPLAVGDEAALDAWRAAVSELNENALPVAAHFGVAGAGRVEDQLRARRLIARMGLDFRVTLSDDARIAFRANAEYPGAILVAGTGSIAVAYDKRGMELRAGGHGYLLGDEGSAYWIGTTAVRAALRAEDGRGPATQLVDLVPRLLGVNSLDDIVSGTYSSVIDRSALASLAPEVVALDDEVARALTTQAIDELVAAISAACMHLPSDAAAFTIVLTGGLLSDAGPILRPLAKRLEEAMPRARVLPGTTRPAVGAARIAMETSFG